MAESCRLARLDCEKAGRHSEGMDWHSEEDSEEGWIATLKGDGRDLMSRNPFLSRFFILTPTDR
jgi:hypothetical protein